MDPSAAASSSTSGASKANYDVHGGGTGGSSNSASSSWKNNNNNTGTAQFPLSLHNKGKLGNVHFFLRMVHASTVDIVLWLMFMHVL